MSLIHDSLRKLESKHIKNVMPDSKVQADYSETPKNNLFNKSWVLGFLLFAVLLILFLIIRANGIGINNLDLTSNEKLQQMNEDIFETKSETYREELSLVDDKVKTPIPVVTLQPLVEVKETVKKETSEVPSIGSMPEKTEFSKIIIVPRQTPPQKTQPSQPIILKKKPPVLISHVRKTKAKKTSKLTVKETRQLVNNLQMYIEEKDKTKVESLLLQLQKNSGANSLVYLRMHAYWSSLQKDDETAVRMYKKILFQKPNDIHAGTNLALIEARQDHLEEAVNRLKSLQKYYPSDKSIQGYIKRIEVMK